MWLLIGEDLSPAKARRADYGRPNVCCHRVTTATTTNTGLKIVIANSTSRRRLERSNESGRPSSFPANPGSHVPLESFNVSTELLMGQQTPR